MPGRAGCDHLSRSPGLDLGPVPEPGAIRAAMLRVLTNPSFETAIEPSRAAIGKSAPLTTVEEIIAA